MTDVTHDGDTSWVVAVPNATGNLFNYVLRLGAKYDDVETKIASAAGVTYTDLAWPATGTLAYATDSYNIIAPSVQTVSRSKSDWVGEHLTASTTKSFWGDTLVTSATYVDGGYIASYVANFESDFYNGGAATTTAGLASTIVLGAYLNSYAPFSLGMVSGIASQVTLGAAVTITNSDAVIATGSGTLSVSTSSAQSASDSIVLRAGSTAAGEAKTTIMVLSRVLEGINLAAQLLSVGNALYAGVKLDMEGEDLAKNHSAVSYHLKNVATINMTASALLVLAQIVATIATTRAAFAMRAAQEASDANAELKLSVGEVGLRKGSASLILTPAGVQILPGFAQDVRDAEDAITDNNLIIQRNIARALRRRRNLRLAEEERENVEADEQTGDENVLQQNLDRARTALADEQARIANLNNLTITAQEISLQANATLKLTVGASYIEITPNNIAINAGAAGTVNIVGQTLQKNANNAGFTPLA